MDVILGRRHRRFKQRLRGRTWELVNAGRSPRLPATPSPGSLCSWMTPTSSATCAPRSGACRAPEESRRPTALVVVLLSNPKTSVGLGRRRRHPEHAARRMGKAHRVLLIGSFDAPTSRGSSRSRRPEDLPSSRSAFRRAGGRDATTTSPPSATRGRPHVKKRRLDAVLHVNAFGQKSSAL